MSDRADTNRTIRSVEHMRHDHRGGGFKTLDMNEAEGAHEIDPFILVTLFEMSAPTFPPHPHAGFAVATYILPESPIGFVNQDSLGTRNRIEPGAIHLTVAGSGAVHEEQPERSGKIAKGFQIWIDLANGRRDIAPQAISLAAGAVPVADLDGAHIRVLAGESNRLTSPLRVPTPIRIVDVTLDPNARFIQRLEERENAFLIVHGGAVEIDGRPVGAGQVVRLEASGTTVVVKAQTERARFTLFAGKPFIQPRVQGGPMVAADEAQLARYRREYEAGHFGSVTAFAHSR